MNQQSQLALLEEVAKAAGVDVSYEPMAGLVQGIGGLCRVNGRYRIIVDRRFKAPERLQILTDALMRLDLDEASLPDEARKLLREGPRKPPRKIAAAGPSSSTSASA